MLVAVTRFNKQTFKINRDWRRKHNYTGCIYPSPLPIKLPSSNPRRSRTRPPKEASSTPKEASASMPPQEPSAEAVPAAAAAHDFIAVLEMHNDYNLIVGIGFLPTNISTLQQIKHNNIGSRLRLYPNNYYNRFLYFSPFRLDISQLQPDDLFIISLLNVLLFTGKRHLKRRIGFDFLSPRFQNILHFHLFFFYLFHSFFVKK